MLEQPASDAWMQRVAAEMNLSETAFLHPIDGGPRYRLRWFTPTVEVELCGHATLATAHVLWERNVLDPASAAEFETRSGLLSARRRDDWIELDFPAEPIMTVVDDPAERDAVASALGTSIVFAGRNRFDLLVELAGDAAVAGLRPDFGKLSAIPGRGVIATSRSSDPAFDFVSRFFAPRLGVDEDPVCGSAHCCLAPFWGGRLGRTAMTGRQISARGGVVKVRLDGPRVALIGQATTVLRCELLTGPE